MGDTFPVENPYGELDELNRGSVLLHDVSPIAKDLNVPRHVAFRAIDAIERWTLGTWAMTTFGCH
jgi:hypothetical protein